MLTEDQMEDAIEDAKEHLEAMAGPDKMSQAEAIEFYRGMAQECNDWARLIESEMEEAADDD